jgi:hypothetical protein
MLIIAEVGKLENVCFINSTFLGPDIVTIQVLRMLLVNIPLCIGLQLLLLEMIEQIKHIILICIEVHQVKMLYHHMVVEMQIQFVVLKIQKLKIHTN